MKLTQCSILNPHSPDVDNNRMLFVRKRTKTGRIELQFGSEQLFWVKH